MTRCRPLALLLLALVFAVRSEAISIGLAPSPIAATVGGMFSLDLVVAGLVGGAAPSLGSWDLDVTFDAGLMSLDSVSFGSLLGGPVDSLQDAVPNGVGSWNASEISLLSPAELDALQPGSFVLATLGFSALAAGTSSVVLSNGIAGDGVGRPLELQLGAARVELVGGGTVVPEPGAALLFACGALLVARARGRARP